MERRDREREWDEDGDAKCKVDKGRVHEPWKPSPTSTLDGGGWFSSDNGEWSQMALTWQGHDDEVPEWVSGCCGWWKGNSPSKIACLAGHDVAVKD